MSLGDLTKALSLWNLPEYRGIRQAILVFGGDINREILIDRYFDVDLLQSDSLGTQMINGVLYLTSKRFVFLPGNSMPHQHLVQAEYATVKSLNGSKNDMMITIVEKSGGYVSFKYSGPKTLFVCFHMLRKILEGCRQPADVYLKVISQILTDIKKDESPFLSIEVDLQPMEKLDDVLPAKDGDSSEEREYDPLSPFIKPVKTWIDRFNRLNFDTHTKLRFVALVAFTSCVLQHLPLFPLVCFFISIYVLYRVWLALDNRVEMPAAASKRDTSYKDPLTTVQCFIAEWFQWRSPKKTKRLLLTCISLFFTWAVLPSSIYNSICLLALIVLFIRPVLADNVLSNLVGGFWFNS